uniref:Uncharacterized protein n=3 Tax=Oryza TaxID=4527 RepID=Q2RAI5_ORYSJ|nr:hypothetical protein LOC_Os11g05270 [Oryza sativa Japonica Group]ABA91501.1 hypothetical protein LOC_Os11g05270 [Oryza sativa Japonica Group]
MGGQSALGCESVIHSSGTENQALDPRGIRKLEQGQLDNANIISTENTKEAYVEKITLQFLKIQQAQVDVGGIYVSNLLNKLLDNIMQFE